MGTKRRLNKGNTSKRRQKLYKMKGCSKKRCVGGKKKTRGGRGRPKQQHLFVTYTGGADVVPMTNQAPGSSVFGSQSGGCGGGGQCSLQGGGGGGGSALVGGPWNPDSPGQLPVPNNYALNTYNPVDISRQMIAAGAQPPFSGGGKRRRRKTQQGGGMTDYPAYYGGIIRSAFSGTPMPVSPAPTDGQFASMRS